MQVLEQLESRVRRRQTMHYVDGDYNGAQPTNPTRHVHLSSDDIAMMWKLFDYASLSNIQAVPTQMPEELDLHESNNFVPQIGFEAPEASACVPLRADTQINAANSLAPSMSDFSHEPSLEDWTLLGEQWLANNFVLSGTRNP